MVRLCFNRRAIPNNNPNKGSQVTSSQSLRSRTKTNVSESFTKIVLDASRTAEEILLDQIANITKNRELTIDDFELRDTLGTGTFGRVRLTRIKNQTPIIPVALKILKKIEIIRLKQLEHTKAEKDILLSINHPFIVNMLYCFQDRLRVYMVLEFIPGGELFSLLRDKTRLQNDHARFYCAEIILALFYLHNQKIIYRDLKPENLLISENGHIKITDFGFAKRVVGRNWTLCGTPEYLAPEIIQCKGHSYPVDWWAIGVLVFEMLTGRVPFLGDDPLTIYHNILEGNCTFPDILSLTAKNFIKKLLCKDKNKRLGCSENINHV